MLVSIAWIAPCLVQGQTKDIGAIGSFSLSKDFGRIWSVKMEQELRFNKRLTTYDRSLTSIAVDYSFFRKAMKASLDYDFIHQRQNEIFEFRQRSSFSLSAKYDIDAFEFEFRTRGQSTWRDEKRGDYKFNPKYVWRNKLECAYKIFGSPVKPFISSEIFCPLNSVHGFFMDGYRFTLGAKYRINIRTSMSFLVRYDQDVQQANPKGILYGGLGWNYKL